LRIVLDTDVLVSGLLSPFGAPADVVRLVVSSTVTSCVDARILIEYGQVLVRPKVGFDPDDEPFLEVAIAGRADALVTENLVHVPASARAGVTVLGPAEFFAWVRDA